MKRIAVGALVLGTLTVGVVALRDEGRQGVSGLGCVRRPTGLPAEACLRRTPRIGVVDPGELNRFDESEAVGAGCQPVACSVTAGEDAEERQ